MKQWGILAQKHSFKFKSRRQVRWQLIRHSERTNNQSMHTFSIKLEILQTKTPKK